MAEIEEEEEEQQWEEAPERKQPAGGMRWEGGAAPAGEGFWRRAVLASTGGWLLWEQQQKQGVYLEERICQGGLVESHRELRERLSLQTRRPGCALGVQL